MHLRNSLISYSDRRKIRILEESIVGLSVFVTDGDVLVAVYIVSHSLSVGNLTLLEHRDVAEVLSLDSSLNILSASYVLNLHSVALRLGTFDRHVHIDSQLAGINRCVRYLKLFEELLHLTDDKLCVFRV